MAQTILVVAAHPDDELLGAGGTLIKHVAAGDAVHALILGGGVLSRVGAKKSDQNLVREEAKAAHQVIGMASVEIADFPDNAYDTVSLLSVTQRIEAVLARVKPTIVYTHHEYDLNVDHRLTFQAVLTACRPGTSTAPSKLFTFETLSSSEWQSGAGGKLFTPNTFVDISKELDKKIQALACYDSEMRAWPHPRSLEGIKVLAQYRGMTAGYAAAEAFTLVRATTV